MISSVSLENVSKGIAAVSALIFVFLFGAFAAYFPIPAFVLAAGTGFTLAYYYCPAWFAYLYVFTVSFAAFLNLPVTDGGFSPAVAVALASFGLGMLGGLFAKDRTLFRIFFGRFDQLLPILFFTLMIVSLMNSRAIGYSAKQIQQFFYLLIIYYFLHLTIRNKEIFHRVLFFVLLGGVCVGILGLVEAATGVPIYFFLGKKSILGASVSDSLLNAKLGRINGLVGDAPFHGIYMTMVAMVALYFLFQSKRLVWRLLNLSIFLLAVFNILGTGSRGAFVGLVLALFLFWWLAEIPRKTTIMVSALASGAVLAVLMVVLMPSVDSMRAFTFSDNTSDTTEMRWKNIPVAVKMFADHPVIGNGPDGFVINYVRYAKNVSNLAFRAKTLKTHNTPLQVLAEYGLVGIALFGLVIAMALGRMVSVMRHQKDPRDRMAAVALISAIAAYVFFMATSNTLLDKFFWLLIMLAQVHYSVCRQSGAVERAA